jgi:hypothetical protein
MSDPRNRWGVWFTPDVTHDHVYLGGLLVEDSDTMRRGELFLNEPKRELYFKDSLGAVQVIGTLGDVSFFRLNFNGVREFANDAAAAAASPIVPIGGVYHTAGTLKIRLV